jgi:hypothetical protein
MISMKPHSSSAKIKKSIKKTLPFAVVGTAVAMTIGNPVAWGALAFGLYQITKTNYKSLDAYDTLDSDDQNLFI